MENGFETGCDQTTQQRPERPGGHATIVAIWRVNFCMVLRSQIITSIVIVTRPTMPCGRAEVL